MLGSGPTVYLTKFWYIPWIKFFAGFLAVQYVYGTYKNWQADMERVKDPNKWTQEERKVFAEYVMSKRR